jgi:hypothetical protein
MSLKLELSRVLWRERELLSRLLDLLERGAQIPTAGHDPRQASVASVASEVATLRDILRQTEVLRAVTADAVAAESGLGSNPSLRALADASDEPWRTILFDHRDAFVAMAAQISRTEQASRGRPATAMPTRRVPLPTRLAEQGRPTPQIPSCPTTS